MYNTYDLRGDINRNALFVSYTLINRESEIAVCDP